ncbi:MAG: histidine kinase [Chloroflexi bacterium]|nr:histidine kinase [Chloroflexota bacterium]MDA8218779.1 cache domain-containing protein [Dehalococcoidales bacterium]
MSRLRLRTQIALATFVPLLIFALLAGGVGAFGLRRLAEELLLERQTALAQVAAAGVAGTLRGYVRVLEATAAELAESGDDRARQQQVLRGREPVLAVFTAGAGLLDADGKAVAATAAAGGSLGLNFAERDYFQEARASLSPVFSTAFRDRPSGEAAVLIAVPVLRDGQFAGVFLGEFALSRPEWARDLNLLRSRQGGQAYLIDSASVVIYHPDPGRVESNVQADPELWNLVIGGQPRSALYQSPGSPEVSVATYAPIPGIAWGLIVEEPLTAVLAAIASAEASAAGLMVLGILLAMVALFFTIGRVTRPLNALVAAGSRVAEGGSYETLPLEGPADLRTLIQAINRMAAHLALQQADLRRYARQVVESQEEERLRVSRDLHDETLQELVALAQRIELCAGSLDGDTAAARRQLKEAQTLSRRVLADVRGISQNLRPSILEDLGLVAALGVLVRDLEQQLAGTRVTFELVGEEVRLPRDLELTAFRIAQEALNNVRKHARSAGRVSVALVVEGDGATLVVEDNGPGFDLAARADLLRTGHLGLQGMAERARLFGGELSVLTAPGEGTTITLHLPLASGSEAAAAEPVLD